MEWYNLAMVSLDFRTRTDDDIGTVDTRAFFETQLPALIATSGTSPRRVRASSASSRSRSSTPVGRVDARARRRHVHASTPGADGAAMVELSDDDIADVVNDLKTPMTFLTGGTAATCRAATSATSSTGGSCCAR